RLRPRDRARRHGRHAAVRHRERRPPGVHPRPVRPPRRADPAAPELSPQPRCGSPWPTSTPTATGSATAEPARSGIERGDLVPQRREQRIECRDAVAVDLPPVLRELLPRHQVRMPTTNVVALGAVLPALALAPGRPAGVLGPGELLDL